MSAENQISLPLGIDSICDKALILAGQAKDANDTDAMRAIVRELRQVAAEIEAIADASEAKR